jgi:hypothetical protein
MMNGSELESERPPDSPLGPRQAEALGIGETLAVYVPACPGHPFHHHPHFESSEDPHLSRSPIGVNEPEGATVFNRPPVLCPEL